MEIPKTLWLKHHMKPEHFARCQFFDLPDFLTYRATGFNRRSCCSVACKCSYVPTKGGWQPEFFKKIECFCFKQQTLTANESREMPVVFVIDPDLPKDVKTITLSYTFFEIHAPSAIAPAMPNKGT